MEPTPYPKNQHETKPVSGNIHRGQYVRFLVEHVPGVKGLEGVDEDHGGGDVTKARVLSFPCSW